MLEEAKKQQSDVDSKILDTRAAGFIDSAKEVADTEEALAGARDIIAEIMNENQNVKTHALYLADLDTTKPDSRFSCFQAFRRDKANRNQGAE